MYLSAPHVIWEMHLISFTEDLHIADMLPTCKFRIKFLSKVIPKKFDLGLIVQPDTVYG